MIPYALTGLLAVGHICAIVAAGHALLTKRNPRSALGWTVALLFLPVIGLAAYLVFGIGRAQSHAERIMKELAQIERHFTRKPLDGVSVPIVSAEAETLNHVGQSLTADPLYAGNSVLPLHDGDNAYPRMIAAIYEAKSQVFLSTYIFNYGHVAQAFIHALYDAHLRGVDVRVLVDGVGALYSWKKPWEILASLGVATVRFRPPSLVPPRFGINLRSHRKMLLCDKKGFTGGMNISDGNVFDAQKFEATIGALEDRLRKEGGHPGLERECELPPIHGGKRNGQIQDVQFLLQGPILSGLRKAFLINWSFCAGTVSELPLMENETAGSCACRVVIDGPGRDGDALDDLICGAINLSRRQIRIMTPYFLPTQDLVSALRSAARRGVDVRVVLPAKNNLPYMNWATQRILPTLLLSGVRVWYQKPPFSHAKLFTMDGFYSLIGSANLDARSLRLNFELNTEIYDPEISEGIASFIDQSVAGGREIKLAALRSQPLWKQLRNSACWIFSPYL